MAETLWSVRAVCSRNSGRYIMQQDATRKVVREAPRGQSSTHWQQGGRSSGLGGAGKRPARDSLTKLCVLRSRRFAYASTRLYALYIVAGGAGSVNGKVR